MRSFLRPFAATWVVVVSACHTTTASEAMSGCHAIASPTRSSARPTGAGTFTRVTGLNGRPFGVDISSNGEVFVTEQDANAVARLSLATLATSAPVGVGADPGDVVFSRDGRSAYVSNYYGGTIDVITVASGERTRTIPIDSTNAYRVALSPDDARLYVTSMNGYLYAVDVGGQSATSSVHLGDALQGIALTRNGGALFLSGRSGKVWRLDACTLAATDSTTIVAGSLQDIALSPDESELYVAGENGFVDVLDPATLAPRRHYPLSSLRPFGMAVTSDGGQLYIASAQTGVVAILDAGTGAVLQTLPVGGVPRRIAFDAAGTTAVVANEGNWVDLIR